MNEANLIEAVLEGLKDAHTSIDKSIENLIEVEGFDESDFVDLKANIKKLLKLNINIQELLIAVLRNGYDSTKVKKSLINLSLMNSIKRDNDTRSAVEWFVKGKLENDNG